MIDKNINIVEDTVLQSKMEQIHNKVRQNLPDLIVLSDDLADNPELSGAEYHACEEIKAMLETYGFEVSNPYHNLPTAFLGTKGKNRKHSVAILAEYDALNGLGHACGHNLSAAISVGAAIVLSDFQDELDTDIHIIGTPGEEELACKVDMIDQHAFDGYDTAIMVHLNNKNLVSCNMYAVDTIRYTFHGKAAHYAAAPWEGRNAMNAVQLFFHAVDMIRQHTVKDSLIHGYISSAGTAANIVPDEAVAEINIRSPHASNLDELVRLVDDCAAGAAIATQTTWEKELTSPRNTDLKQNEFGNQVMSEIYEMLGIQADTSEGYFGSSDIGNVSYLCPTFHPTLNITEDGAPLHSTEFADQIKSDKAHEAIKLGAEVIANFITECFYNEEIVNALLGNS